MAKYLVGKCPECGAVNAGAIWMDDFDTSESWQKTREEFEESGLVVSEIFGPAPTLEGCGCKDKPGKWVMHVIGPDEVHDMPDEITALREANKLNKNILKWRNEDPSPHEPFMVALAKNLDVEEA